MSGRGRGGRRRRGRGGRASSKNHHYGRQQNVEYKFHTKGSNMQTASYEQIVDKINYRLLQNIGDFASDIVDSIREMKKMDFKAYAPTRKESTLTDKADRDDENEIFLVLYKEEISHYAKRRAWFGRNLQKAYGMIYFLFCSEEMRMRINAHPDFESKVRDDPIELLRVIKNFMYVDPATYIFLTLLEALARLVNMRQEHYETLFDYKERFKRESSITKYLFGTEFLNHCVKQTLEYKEAEAANDLDQMAELNKEAVDSFLTCVFLEGCRGGENSTQFGLPVHMKW